MSRVIPSGFLPSVELGCALSIVAGLTVCGCTPVRPAGTPVSAAAREVAKPRVEMPRATKSIYQHKANSPRPRFENDSSRRIERIEVGKETLDAIGKVKGGGPDAVIFKYRFVRIDFADGTSEIFERATGYGFEGGGINSIRAD